MANDSGVFRTAEHSASVCAERSRLADPKEIFVPLYEAKMIHQFNHRWSTYYGEEVGLL